MSKGDKLKVLIVGGGKIAREHGRSVQALSDRCALVGVCDPSEDALRRFSDEFFVPKTYRDLPQAIEDSGCELLAICSPPIAHVDAIRAGLAAGKYVVCEKPLATSLKALDALASEFGDKIERLSTVFQLRYAPGLAGMIAAAENPERFGPFLAGEFRRRDQHPSRKTGGSARWWGDWKVAGGGAAMTQFIHEMDLALRIFGQPESVVARMSTIIPEIESEDVFSATVRFQSGAIVSFVCFLVAQDYAFEINLFGDRGSLHFPANVRSTDGAWMKGARQAMEMDRSTQVRRRAPRLMEKVIRKGFRVLGRYRQPKVGTEASRHAPYYRAVLDAIDAGRPLPGALAEGRAAVELCLGAYLAAVQEREISFPLEASSPVYDGMSAALYGSRTSSEEPVGS